MSDRALVKVCIDCATKIWGEDYTREYHNYNCYRHDRAECHYCKRKPRDTWGSYEDGFCRFWIDRKKLDINMEQLGACDL